MAQSDRQPETTVKDQGVTQPAQQIKWEGHGRFEPIRSSLRVKVTLAVLIPLLLIWGGITAIQVTRHQTAVLNSTGLIAANAGHVIEEVLRHEIDETHFDEAQEILTITGENDDFQVVYLLDIEGNVLFAPGGDGAGNHLSNDEPDCIPCHRLEEAERPESIVVTSDSGERVLRSMIPVENSPQCTVCHEEEETLALLITDTPMTALEATLTADLWENIFWLASAVFGSVIVVNVVLNRFVLSRLKRLTGALTGFGRGRHDLRFPDDDPDEIGQLAEAFNEMGRRVESEEIENRALSLDLRRQSSLRGQLLERLITAQEDERKRLARGVHDELGQAMGGLALQAEVLRRLISPDNDEAQSQLAQIKALITTTTDSMYDLILALRPSALDDLGLVAALRAHAERALANTGIQFEMDATEFDVRLSPEMEIALYRMFQEALNNVVRHASAKHVRFRLAQREGLFEGQVEDDGRGFNPDEIHADDAQTRGLGLLGIRERVAQFGGRLEIVSQYGGGTTVSIQISLQNGD
jgi:signal transduction histidine kinase